MGGRSTIQLLVAALLFSWTAGASYSELRITGTKDFQYRSFSVTGSLNQFLVDFPTFLTDRGFTQSLRLNVTGTVLDNVSVDVSLDDTNDIEKDRKLLVRVDGKEFSLTAGRLTLEAPQTRYLLFNKKALALVGTYRKGRHEVTGLVGRPEGESTRDFFKGRGSQQEYLLRNRPVVQGSEIVQLDGRLLVRGSDYEFDFEEGTLILNRRLLPVEPTSTLTVEYEGTGNGSLFKTTVVGLRERYRLAPCKGRKTGPQTPDRVGVSVVMSQDEVPSAAGSPTTTRSPERLTLVGADLFSELSPGWIVSGEVATSIQQTDLRLDSSATVRGTACDVALGHKGGRLDLRLAHQYLGPGFQAVGKREFVRLGEVNDLSSNLRLTTFNSRFDLTRSLFLDSLAEVSRTNPSHDPAVTRRDFTAVGNVLTLNLGPDSRIAVRHRDDLDDQSRPGAPPVKVTHRVRSGAITRPIAGLVAQVRAETASDRGSDPTAGDTTSLALSLGDSRSKRVKWTVNAQNVSQVSPAALPVRDALTLSGMADLAWSRSTSGSLAVMNRREKDRLLGSEDVVNTGEIRGRYQPSDRFTVNVKTAAEERSRILRVITDPRMAQLAVERNEPRTLATERPVMVTNSSHTMDFRPSQRWDLRLAYRDRDEREVGTSSLLASNWASSGRLKFAPGTVFRTTTEAEVGRAFSRLALLQRDTVMLFQELLWSFKNGWNLSLSHSDTDAKDRNGPGRERTTTEQAQGEKTIGQSFTGLVKAAHTERVQGGRSGENSVGAGVRFSPLKVNLRVQLDLEAATISGVNIRGERFDSNRRKGGVRLDGQPIKDLNVEACLTLVKAGPNAQGEAGYQGWTLESKAFLDF